MSLKNDWKVTVPKSIPNSEKLISTSLRDRSNKINRRAVDGMRESVSIRIPEGSSDGSSKLLIVTPGRLLKAFNVITLLRTTLSKIVPSAVRRSFGVEIVQSKLGPCNNVVAKDVNLRMDSCKIIFLEDLGVHIRGGICDCHPTFGSVIRHSFISRSTD